MTESKKRLDFFGIRPTIADKDAFAVLGVVFVRAFTADSGIGSRAGGMRADVG